MKLVIEIPEEEYNTGQLVHYFGCYSDKLDLVIYNGTPLPKGHGRLIDADALDFEEEINLADNWGSANHIAQIVKDAPTIIEGSESE